MTNYDGPWKETLEDFCAAAIELFFPLVHEHVDWQRSFEFLDKELQRIDLESQWGTGIVDKLIKVWLKNGQETWVLLHLEIQAQTEGRFALRMFAYRCAIFLRYNQEIVSLAILGDDDPSWKPNEYRTERWGSEIIFRFPVVKLLDWVPRADELRVSHNPVAHVVLAHLRALETTRAMDQRHQYKFQVIRNLYDLGFDAETIRKVYRIIDWMMILPDDLEEQFRQEVEQIEEEKKMPYVTSIERLARGQGLRQGIEGLLEFRFGEAGKTLGAEIASINDIERLNAILDAAKKLASLEEMKHFVHGTH